MDRGGGGDPVVSVIAVNLNDYDSIAANASMFCSCIWKKRTKVNDEESCGHSYEHTTIVIYDYSVVNAVFLGRPWSSLLEGHEGL